MSKKQTKKPATKKLAAIKPTLLDETTSALVLAEYLALRDVTAAEIAAILDDDKDELSLRETAMTFRMSELLEIPDQFVMAPRFAEPFAWLRRVLAALQRASQRAA